MNSRNEKDINIDNTDNKNRYKDIQEVKYITKEEVLCC